MVSKSFAQLVVNVIKLDSIYIEDFNFVYLTLLLFANVKQFEIGDNCF